MQPAAVDGEFADVLVVHGTAHLEHRDPAPHLAVDFDVSEQDDGIGQRGDVRLRHRRAACERGRCCRKEPGNLLVLDKGGHADDELAEATDGAHALKGGEAVHRDPVRPEFGNEILDGDQMIFQTRRLRIDTVDLEFALRFHLLEVDAPANRIAEKLLAALFECQQQTALIAVDAAGQELRREQRLARAGRPGDEHNRVAEEAAAAQAVEVGVARGNAQVGRALL